MVYRDCAMTTFARSVEIEAPQAWLFAIMQDYPRRLAWDEFLSKAELVGDATVAGIGARAWCVDRAGRGMATVYVAFRPPDRVAVKMTKGPWMVSSFAGSWVYRALDDTRTELTFRYALELRPRWLGTLGDRLLAGLIRQVLRDHPNPALTVYTRDVPTWISDTLRDELGDRVTLR